jgi:hypothetical protein
MPDDLRSVHRFARAAQERFRGRADWWEPWNEPDISVFSEDPADQLAAFQKAAYLGFKAADPRSTVLMVSLALPPGPFIESFLENETAPYFEVYNYHIYDAPEGHVSRARAHSEVCERFGLGDKPLWVTEAGIGIKTPTGDLTHDEAVRQAEFLPRSYVLSLSSGVSRHFFFILPHFIERGVQFALLEREQRPGPGYVALAALTAALGNAGAPRELRGLPAGLRGWLFARGDGRHAAAIWSEAAAPVALPGAAGLEARDLYGRRLEIGEEGSLRVPGTVTYLVGQEDRFAQWSPSTTAPRIRVAPPDFQLSSVVLRFAFPPDRTDKGREAWRVGGDGALDGRLQVYNFGTTPFDGTIRVSCDRGLEVEPAERPIRVAPDGLESAEIRLRWKEEGDAFRRVRAVATEPAAPGGAERRSSAAVIRLVR